MRTQWIVTSLALIALGAIVFGATVNRSVRLTNFNAGQLSEQTEGRGYYAKYIATVKDSTDRVRLIPFEYSTEDAYILELGDQYIRFYRNRAQVLSGGNAYEVNSPWDANDIFELQFAQDAQTMRFRHPDYKPCKLVRNSASHTDWTLSEVNDIDGPFLDENTAMTILAERITGEGITQTDLQERPDPTLWCVREDGVLLSFTYQRQECPRSSDPAQLRPDLEVTDE